MPLSEGDRVKVKPGEDRDYPNAVGVVHWVDGNFVTVHFAGGIMWTYAKDEVDLLEQGPEQAKPNGTQWGPHTLAAVHQEDKTRWFGPSYKDKMLGGLKGMRDLGTELGELCEEKNLAYGNSFARTDEFFKFLYPDGIRPDQYADALCLVRIYDKLMRIASGHDGAFGEEAYKDIVGYALLGAKLHERNR